MEDLNREGKQDVYGHVIRKDSPLLKGVMKWGSNIMQSVLADRMPDDEPDEPKPDVKIRQTPEGYYIEHGPMSKDQLMCHLHEDLEE